MLSSKQRTSENPSSTTLVERGVGGPRRGACCCRRIADPHPFPATALLLHDDGPRVPIDSVFIVRESRRGRGLRSMSVARDPHNRTNPNSNTLYDARRGQYQHQSGRVQQQEPDRQAELVEDTDEVARIYANLIEEYGREQAVRRLGIRINVDRMPTREELVDALERSVLSFVAIDLGKEDRLFGQVVAGEEVAPGVVRLASGVVNAYLVGEVGGPWVLADAGTPGNAEKIRAAAQERFGQGARPEAIVLTHGHADHSGSAAELSDWWDVPVYAHRLELPFLTGLSAYPPPDPTVGGPFALLSRFIPRKIIDLGEEGARELPAGGEVPGMRGWRWIHTSGHTPGHVCLWRSADRVLLAGDALATLDADSFSGMLSRTQEISRPATPVTPDWEAAERSVKEMASLRPRVLAPGHGEPMEGPTVAEELAAFAGDFAAPEHGRYVFEPARFDERGVAWLPPAPPDPLPKIAAALGVVLLAGTAAVAWLAVARRRG